VHFWCQRLKFIGYYQVVEPTQITLCTLDYRLSPTTSNF